MSDNEMNESFDLDVKRAEVVPVIQKSIKAIDIEANGDTAPNNGTNEKPVHAAKLDPIQHAMGQFGRWHFLVCAVIFLLKFPVAWHQMSIIFMAPNIDFDCIQSNVTDKCSAECTSYQFDRSVFTETLQMTWNLVCDRKHMANLSQTIFMFGILVGNILFGTLADKYGRRGPLVAAVFIQLLAGVGSAFSPWFWLFCALRFITAAATGGTMVTSFVLVMELIGTKWRELISVLYQIPFNLGHLTLPLFAYFLRDWHQLQFALSIPSILLISYYWLVPESPRWLFTVGRINESACVLEKAAAFNERPTESIKLNLEKYAISTNTKVGGARGNILDLVRTPNMRTKTISMCFNWMVCGMCFFGVAQYIGQSETKNADDIFRNVAVSAALELPGTILCIFTMKKFGRKLTLICSNSLAGICMLLIALLPAYQVVLASIALVGMSISFPTVYLYAGEIFPTVVRNVGVGSASMIARIGSMVAPFVIALKTINVAYPPIALGVIPIIGALLVLLLPETKGAPLPATIEDGENFGKKQIKA